MAGRRGRRQKRKAMAALIGGIAALILIVLGVFLLLNWENTGLAKLAGADGIDGNGGSLFGEDGSIDDSLFTDENTYFYSIDMEEYYDNNDMGDVDTDGGFTAHITLATLNEMAPSSEVGEIYYQVSYMDKDKNMHTGGEAIAVNIFGLKYENVAKNYGYNIKLIAKPKSGYKFLRWEGFKKDDNNVTGYVSYDDPTIQMLNITAKSVEFSAIFINKNDTSYATSTIKAKAEPAGTVYVNDKLNECTVLSNDNVTLKAVAADDTYEFNYWTNEVGTRFYEGSTWAIGKVTGDETYTAHFSKKTHTITAKTNDPNLGTVSFAKNDNFKDSASKGSIPNNGSVTIYAKAKTAAGVDNTAKGVKFVRWESSDGKTYQNNPLELTNITSDETYYAVFTDGTSEEYPKISYSVSAPKTTIGLDKDQLVGKVDVTNPSKIEGQADNVVKSGGSLTLTAKLKDGIDSTKYKFERWESIGGKTSTANPLNLVNILASDSYTAVFTEINDPEKEPKITVIVTGAKENNTLVGEVNNDQLSRAYSEKVEGSVAAGGTMYFTAKLKDGVDASKFKFERWESASTGKTYTSNPLTLTNIKTSDTIYAVFSEITSSEWKPKITAKASGASDSSGNIVGQVKAGSKDFGETSYDEVLAGGSMTLTAKLKDGVDVIKYKFERWESTSGKTSTANPLTLTNITASDTYSAIFTTTYSEDNPEITARASGVKDSSGNVVGSVQIDSSEFADSESKSVVATGSMTLTAKLKDGVDATKYKFERWESTSGKTSTANPLTLTNITASDTYSAIFTEVLSEANPVIKVAFAPSGMGEAGINDDYSVTTKTVTNGSSLTLTARLNDKGKAAGYKFERWESNSGKVSTTNPLQLVDITESDTYTAVFNTSGTEDNPSITIKTAPSGKGYVEINGSKVADGSSKTVKAGDSLTLTAQATDSQYFFERWQSTSGSSSSTNPLQLADITKSDTWTAVFNVEATSLGIKVNAIPASGGVAKKFLEENGSGARLTAMANKGYHFVCWKKGNDVIAAFPSCVVSDVSDGVIYEAVFEKDSNYDAKSSLAHEYFYTDKRRYTDPNYAVTRQSLLLKAGITVANERDTQYDDAAPPVSTYIAVENAKSLYDDVQIRDDKSVLEIDSELVTSDGAIMPVTSAGDSTYESSKAESFVADKFGSMYSYEILNSILTNTPENYEGGELTCLWKYQDVNRDDNIYILCESNGSEDFKSAIIDEDKIIKFSLTNPGSDMRLTLVRIVFK